jgi:serine/threonine protein kinase
MGARFSSTGRLAQCERNGAKREQDQENDRMRNCSKAIVALRTTPSISSSSLGSTSSPPSTSSSCTSSSSSIPTNIILSRTKSICGSPKQVEDDFISGNNKAPFASIPSSPGSCNGRDCSYYYEDEEYGDEDDTFYWNRSDDDDDDDNDGNADFEDDRYSENSVCTIPMCVGSAEQDIVVEDGQKAVPFAQHHRFVEDNAKILKWKRGELIGRGAFGHVWLALSEADGTLMAVKSVSIKSTKEKSTEEIVAALEGELSVMRMLRHPNIVQYKGTQRAEDELHIFMQYIPGGSLQSMIKRFGALPESVARSYTAQILEGIQYLHGHGIIHRDIKGANVLVDADGACKLADFGACQRLKDVTDGSIRGTPYWVAPEVLKGEPATCAVDIWSLGCTVIEMLTGQAPWAQYKSLVSVLFYIANTKEPELPEDLGETARDFLTFCLKVDPESRPSVFRAKRHPFVAPAVEDLRRCSRLNSQSRLRSASSISSLSTTISRYHRTTPHQHRRHHDGTGGREHSIPQRGGNGGSSICCNAVEGAAETAECDNATSMTSNHSYRRKQGDGLGHSGPEPCHSKQVEANRHRAPGAGSVLVKVSSLLLRCVKDASLPISGSSPLRVLGGSARHKVHAIMG